MKVSLLIIVAVTQIWIAISCANPNSQDQKASVNGNPMLETEQDTTKEAKAVYLDTTQVSRFTLDKLVAEYKPQIDIQYDLDKANWGGDFRIELRNYFSEDEIFPKNPPKTPILIREVTWKTANDQNITYWYQKVNNDWKFIYKSDPYIDSTEF
ncbi:hypothetical protein [Sphingobacterium hungaricum]|uniref:DUF4348 domain-containing protein n=1 Tax=Sphingobacterium hungaricum TaxID=2082723 RepID=A0A928UY94_9SPHI|nr:hypothetical protein [Sphingobacterium hungaricum]MBE8714228.1 hypothetical protein [Sphingobacterium hungaricum]